ncbi:hypothetical protein L9F63_008868, partial [Diploptera punctata]
TFLAHSALFGFRTLCLPTVQFLTSYFSVITLTIYFQLLTRSANTFCRHMAKVKDPQPNLDSHKGIWLPSKSLVGYREHTRRCQVTFYCICFSFMFLFQNTFSSISICP